MLEPKIRLPQKPLKLNYQQRQDASVQRDLKAINELLDTAKFTKGSRGIGECWPAPLADVMDKSRSAMTQRRTSTRPTGEAKRDPVDQYVAVTALMCKIRAEVPPIYSCLLSLDSCCSLSHFPERPETPVLAPTATPESGRDAAAVLIQRLLRGRAAQNAMYEGRMRRQALIEELKLEGTDAGETAAVG